MRSILFAAGLMLGMFRQDIQVLVSPVHYPATELTQREIIEMLADYDVVHREQQPFFMPAFGVTNFESTPPTVWIFNTGDTPSRRSTVIHELLHVHYHQLGLDPPETFIRDEEARLYAKWFLN